MKRLIIGVIALCSGSAYGVDYSMVYAETASVYAQNGTLRDRSEMSVKTILSVNRSDRIAVDFQSIELEAKDGACYLKMQPEMFDVFSRGRLTPEPPSRLYISPSEPKALEWICSNHVLEGVSYRDLERGALALLAEEELDYAAVFPLACFANKVPFVWNVGEDVKPGTVVEIPFRPALDPNHASSTERAASLVCVEDKGRTVVLESNRQKDARRMLVSWHVRVVFDKQRQLPTSIIEERFSKIMAPAGDSGDTNIHTVRESVKCYLLQ